MRSCVAVPLVGFASTSSVLKELNTTDAFGNATSLSSHQGRLHEGFLSLSYWLSISRHVGALVWAVCLGRSATIWAFDWSAASIGLHLSLAWGNVAAKQKALFRSQLALLLHIIMLRPGLIRIGGMSDISSVQTAFRCFVESTGHSLMAAAAEWIASNAWRRRAATRLRVSRNAQSASIYLIKDVPATR